MANLYTPSRRAVLAGAASAAIGGVAHAEPAPLSFLIVGDWGARSPAQHDVAEAMARVAAEIGSAFVISTGDNFYTNGVASTRDPQWNDTFEQVFSAPSLQTPWYAVLGNHDERGSSRAEIDYTQRSFRWRMRSRYWREDMRVADATTSFYFLDTTPLTHLDTLNAYLPVMGDRNESHQQIEWFQRAISGRPADWNIVIGHHPIFSSGAHGGERTLARHIQPSLEAARNVIYFNGHDHDLEHVRHGAVNYFCSGAGSESRAMSTPIDGSLFTYGGAGFLSCTLAAETMNVRFHDHQGATLYATQIARV